MYCKSEIGKQVITNRKATSSEGCQVSLGWLLDVWQG